MAHPDMAALLSTLVGAGEPGIAIGVYSGGELVASATAGCASVEHGAAITEHTAFDIASMSKHMTATCVLLLVRDGLIDLDVDIRRYLPELALTQPITLRQCLTHTAGLRDYFSLCELAGIPVAGITEGRFWHLITGQRELDFPAGSAFSYSNTGYALAAVVVRRLTGQSLAAYARDRVFGPLGMTATCFRDDVSVIVPGLASGYLARADGTVFARCEVTEEIVGDGAVVTTIADLARWHAFIVNGAVLGTGIRDGLLSRQVLTDGTALGYALGLEAIDVVGEAAWWHSGSWAGYRAAVIYLPGRGTGVSVLANRNDHYASYLADAVATSLVTGEDLRSCYAARLGVPESPDVARLRAKALAGRWHEPDQDVFIDFVETEPGVIALREHGEEYRLFVGTDGVWHGTGTGASLTYMRRDGTLCAGWGLSARPEGWYKPAEAAGPDHPAIPLGIYRNGELGAHAEISVDDSGAGRIVIGLAEPRRLEPAFDSAGAQMWLAGGLTVRVDPGRTEPGLLISLPGAHDVRFDRVTVAPAARGVMRGLTARPA
jgi:CubicO group peptidase (beta-lactamase class C family)